MQRIGTWLAGCALGLALVAGSAGRAEAAPADNCPLAREPYSLDTPLADLARDPAARAALGAAAPQILPVLGQLPGGFSRIMTPRTIKEMVPGLKDKEAAIAQALAGVKLTPEAIAGRCSAYDFGPPPRLSPVRRPAVLVFDKITGFRDGPSVDAAAAALKEIAARRGWSIVFSDKGTVMEPRALARFDAVIWNNVSGDALTLRQRAAFRAYIENGGGFAGIHGSAGDPVMFWDWYTDRLVGARFIGHAMNPQFQTARVVTEGRSAETRGLPGEWRLNEEWYSFAKSPRGPGTRVLARIDESTYKPTGFTGESIAMGDHPVAWVRCLGSGRSFYTAIGHRPENYVEANALRLLEQGIVWAVGQGGTRCLAGHEVARRGK